MCMESAAALSSVWLERLEETLKQAKRAGPNRTFAHDGKEAEQVDSPDLRADAAEIPI